MLIGTFIALQCLLTLYGAYILFTDVRDNGCDPSSSEDGNHDCTTTGVNIFGALLGITFSAQGVSQVASFYEALSAARAACYPAMQAINRTVGSDLGREREMLVSNKYSIGDESTDEESGDDVHGPSEMNAILPKYEIDSSFDGGRKTPIIEGSIQFKDVVFAYPYVIIFRSYGPSLCLISCI